ncbi:MAG: phospholipase A [Ramlibacter sp.]
MPRILPLLQCAAAAALLPLAAPAAAQDAGWQACSAIGAAADRLACFDRWAETQRAAPPPAGPVVPAASALASPATAAALPPPVTTGPWRNLRLTTLDGCHDINYSPMSRYWELEPGADCGIFGIRGYRPLSVSVVAADTVNRQPRSGNPLNNAVGEIDYRNTEMRLQLSVRTKVAQGLIRPLAPQGTDSLWVGYTQQSYWQLFNPGLSRPFRSTDHEPELVYVLPLQGHKDGEWRLRYGGVGLVHQSNGQSLPYSRSWNRVYAMLGAEGGPFQLQGRAWHRLPEDAVDNDNPGISNYIGRAELRGSWQVNPANLVAVTGRHSLKSPGRGSVRLEWFRALGPDSGALQLHTQLFSGFGDSLLDYNRKRTVLSVGFSLVDW